MLAEGEKVIKIEWFCLCEAFVTMLTVISTLGTSSCMGSTDVSPSPSDTRLFGSGETSHQWDHCCVQPPHEAGRLH